jgi:hypothetical protein
MACSSLKNRAVSPIFSGLIRFLVHDYLYSAKFHNTDSAILV